MAKSSFVLIMLSMAMSLAILAPTLNLLLDVEPDSSVLVNLSEEEPNKSEKEICEKDIVLAASQKFESYSSGLFKVLSGFYKEDTSTFDGKILLPPPERIS